jgi:predicted metalloenzyme YecM
VKAKWPAVELVVPAEGLCPIERCISKIDDEAIYRDGGHVSRNLPDDTKEKLAQLIGLGHIFQ